MSEDVEKLRAYIATAREGLFDNWSMWLGTDGSFQIEATGECAGVVIVSRGAFSAREDGIAVAHLLHQAPALLAALPDKRGPVEVEKLRAVARAHGNYASSRTTVIEALESAADSLLTERHLRETAERERDEARDGERAANAVADKLAAYVTRLKAAEAEQQQAATKLFDAIVHGDDEHRAWLKEAIDAHFVGLPVPPARGGGTAEKLLREARQFVHDCCDDEDAEPARHANDLLRRIDARLSILLPAEGERG